MSRLAHNMSESAAPHPSSGDKGPQTWIFIGCVLLLLLAGFVWLILNLNNETRHPQAALLEESPGETEKPRPSSEIPMKLRSNGEDISLELSEQPASGNVANDAPTEHPMPDFMKNLGPDDLKSVRDSQPMLAEEKQAYYYAAWQAWLLQKTSGDDAVPPVLTRTRFYDDPESLRGKPVTVRGDIGSVMVVNLDPNPTGRLKIYQVGLLSDGGPVFVLAWEDPTLQKIRLNETVEFTGIFYKIWEFSGEKKLTAPLLMTPTLERVTSSTHYLTQTVGIGLTVLLLTIILLLLWNHHSRKRRDQARMQRPIEAELGEELDELDRRLNEPPAT